MSVEGVRRCNETEMQILREVWSVVQPVMEASSNGRYSEILSWSNFYQNKKFKINAPIMQKFLKWCENLVQQIYPGDHIICCSFVRNPPRSKRNQVWHLDYEKASTIMIPLVNQTLDTATQVIQGNLKQQPYVSQLGYKSHFDEDILSVMQRENKDFIKVSQIACKSYTILKVDGGSVHRGKANDSDQQRVLFTINCCPTYFELAEEPLVVSNFKQE